MILGTCLSRSKRFEVVSFDIFDTLIKRDVSEPTDIFYEVAKKQFADKDEIRRFHGLRISAEREARENAYNSEVTLDDIYATLEPMYGKELCARLSECEIETELECCSANSTVVEEYEKQLKKGATIVLVSDMYLPYECITSMLQKCGIRGYKKLYISHMYKCDKVSGELFKIVLDELGIPGNRMVHYGDNIKADLLGARKVGVASRLVVQRKFFRTVMKKVTRKFCECLKG